MVPNHLPFPGAALIAQSSATITHKEPSRVRATFIRRLFSWVHLPPDSAYFWIPFSWGCIWLVKPELCDGTSAGRKWEEEGISGFCLAWEGGIHIVTNYKNIYRKGNHRCWVASHNECWLYVLTFLVFQIKWKKCWMLPDESIIKSRLVIIKGKYQRNLKCYNPKELYVYWVVKG